MGIRQRHVFMLVFLLPIVGIALSGCVGVQATSGRTYLERYPDVETFRPNSRIDAEVRAAAAIEPLLKLPSRIGIARIDQGRISPIPEIELNAWLKLSERRGALGEFVPINPFLAEIGRQTDSMSSASNKVGTPQYVTRVVDNVRLAAARQHVDVVLMYEVFGKSKAEKNILSVADITVIGAFLLPGRTIDAVGHASALLVDVRNGYPYLTTSATVDQKGLVRAVAGSEGKKAYRERAKSSAAVELVDRVDSMVDDLIVAFAEPSG